MAKNNTIFKEYDIRGKYPNEINERKTRKIGRAYVSLLKLKAGDKIVVGRDRRPSSPKLAKSLVNSLIGQGVSVLDIGIVTTPMLYFAVSCLRAKGGVMVTASHNPTSHNGIKLVKEKAEPISGEEIQVALKKASTPNKKKKGECKEVDIKKRYLEAMFDGYNIPQKTKLKYSFDKDGDRLMIKDKKGKTIRGDIIGGIIASQTAKKGNTIIYDLRCSHSIPRYFRNKGVIAIPGPVGHYNIKKLMKERGAILGMELTGHYYFKKFNYADAPLYALKILSERVDKNKERLTELITPFDKYFHSGIIDFKIKNFDKVVNNLKEKYRNGAQSSVDGLTIEFSNWWFNIRPSKTEDTFRLVVEANAKNLLDEKVKEVKKAIS